MDINMDTDPAEHAKAREHLTRNREIPTVGAERTRTEMGMRVHVSFSGCKMKQLLCSIKYKK